MHLIMVPHLKLFSICSVTGHPQNLDNICHAPGSLRLAPTMLYICQVKVNVHCGVSLRKACCATIFILLWYAALCGRCNLTIFIVSSSFVTRLFPRRDLKSEKQIAMVMTIATVLYSVSAVSRLRFVLFLRRTR